jgi:hypothetical protein
MTEILISCWTFIAGLTASLWDVLFLALTWVWSVVYHLHTAAPRLEGLLVGVLLAWLMLRRDRHPLLRVLSAPLKLVVDILDLAWDQSIEVLSDLWETTLNWVNGAKGWAATGATRVYSRVMSTLQSIKSKLSSKPDED